MPCRALCLLLPPLLTAAILLPLSFCFFGNVFRVLMFANISPCASHADETLCSLQFAARVNNVQLGAAKKKADPKLGVKLKRVTE